MTRRQLETLEELIKTNPVAVAHLLLQVVKDAQSSAGNTVSTSNCVRKAG